MNDLPRWLVIFNNVSTTNSRIYVTLMCVVGTAMTYWFKSVIPDANWLLFMAGLAGIDVAHYTSKRFSASEFVAAKNPASAVTENPSDTASTASTDVRELSEQKG